MLRATIVRIDNSVLIEDAEIRAQNAKRGLGDGLVWRGIFAAQGAKPRPMLGETLYLRLAGDTQTSGVVTEIDGERIHFRAHGQVPLESPVAVHH